MASIKSFIVKQRTYIVVVAWVLCATSAGLYLLTDSRAASPSVISEAENGTLEAGATIFTEATASEGKAVQFTHKNCSGTGNAKVGETRGGLMGFANGYRYGQLSAVERERYMDIIADTGVKWYRMNMDSWNLTQYQDVVSRTKARGICVLGNISANSNGTHWANPPDHQVWANQAADMVAQLKNDVHVWEIWNEQNYHAFWPSPDANAYADLLHRTYVAIKAVDPTAVVLAGGTAPCGDNTNPCNAVNFLKTMYIWNKNQGRKGSAELFDGIAHHPYGYPWNPLDPANATQSWNAFYQTYLLHQVMADPNYGGSTNDGAKRIWSTEGGAPTECNLPQCLTLAEASNRITAQMNVWTKDWGAFTGPFIWYEVQNQPGIATTNPEHYFGFIRADWTIKYPMYSALKTYAHTK